MSVELCLKDFIDLKPGVKAYNFFLLIPTLFLT